MKTYLYCATLFWEQIHTTYYVPMCWYIRQYRFVSPCLISKHTRHITYSENDAHLRYRLFLPLSCLPSNPYLLIMLLHGNDNGSIYITMIQCSVPYITWYGEHTLWSKTSVPDFTAVYSSSQETIVYTQSAYSVNRHFLRSTRLPIQLFTMCRENGWSTWDWNVWGMVVGYIRSIRAEIYNAIFPCWGQRIPGELGPYNSHE